VHVPLVHDFEGERLAKRHRHYELALLRESGVSPKAVIGYLAYHAGVLSELAPVTPEDCLSHFDIQQVPRKKVVLEEKIENTLLHI